MKEKLLKLRNELYNDLPVGEINAFDMTYLIKRYLQKIDMLIDETERLPADVVEKVADAAANYANKEWGKLESLSDEDKDNWFNTCAVFTDGANFIALNHIVQYTAKDKEKDELLAEAFSLIEALVDDSRDLEAENRWREGTTKSNERYMTVVRNNIVNADAAIAKYNALTNSNTSTEIK